MKCKKLKMFVFVFISFIMIGIVNNNIAYSSSDVPKFHLNKISVTGDDQESIVFLFVGDGFTKKEQPIFDKKVEKLKNYILKTNPFVQFKDNINFYSLNVISNESGAANNPKYLKDTYFQSSYNCFNIERLLVPFNPSAAFELADYYVPNYDYIIMVVNDERYGGSGGTIPVTSINSDSYEILVHEMGHTVGGLSDEYWAGDIYAAETSNMSQVKDPLKVRWKGYIGKNGIGVYPYEENPKWFRPSQNCKMRFLGNEFCDVCISTLTQKLENLRWMTNSIDTYEQLLAHVKVTPSKKTLYVGGSKNDTVKLKLSMPSILKRVSKFTESTTNADNMEVKVSYQSKDKKIAEVSKDGVIKAKSKGKTTITVRIELVNGTKITKKVPITISAAKVVGKK